MLENKLGINKRMRLRVQARWSRQSKIYIRRDLPIGKEIKICESGVGNRLVDIGADVGFREAETKRAIGKLKVNYVWQQKSVL